MMTSKMKKRSKQIFCGDFLFKYTGTPMLLNSWEKYKSFREKGKCILNMKNNYYFVFVPGVKKYGGPTHTVCLKCHHS